MNVGQLNVAKKDKKSEQTIEQCDKWLSFAQNHSKHTLQCGIYNMVHFIRVVSLSLVWQERVLAHAHDTNLEDLKAMKTYRT